MITKHLIANFVFYYKKHVTLKIHKILEKELELLQIIAQKSFFETYAHLNDKNKINHYINTNLSLAQLRKEYHNPESLFYFAKIEENIVAYLKLNFGKAQTESSFDSAMEIERIYVLKEFQQKEIGFTLLNHSFKIAKERKLDRIWLGVWIKNPQAINFYKKNGFKECGKHIFQFVDEAQTDLLMQLDLNKI